MTYPCVLLIQKSKQKDNVISYVRLDSLEKVSYVDWNKANKILQKEFETGDCKFIISENKIVSDIIKKIDNKSQNIGSMFAVARGLANNKVDFQGKSYKAIKSKSVNRYDIGESINIDTDFADRFINEMVILPRTVLKLKSTIKPPRTVLLDRIYYLSPLNKRHPSNEFVVGILNSKLTNFWFEFYYNSTKVSGNFFDLNGNQIKSIPLPVCSQLEQDKISLLVQNIMRESVSNMKIEYENEIDFIVYHLYGLTYDEIQVVDPHTSISREEYEKSGSK